MVKTLSLNNIDEVMVFLSYNRLRWIPDELFSIKGLEHLNLQNNLLGYIPQNIKNAKDYLNTLILGNYERYQGLRALKGVASCRKSGNRLKAFPPAILQLTNLQKLDIKSVGLEECPDDELYKTLLKLVSLDVSCNNLPIIPKSIFENRNVEVISYDNPGHSLTLGVKTLHKMDLFWNALARQHHNAMAFIGAHPGAFALITTIILPISFLGAFYLEYGSHHGYLEYGSDGLWIIKKI
jgi:hypothetical protein